MFRKNQNKRSVTENPRQNDDVVSNIFSRHTKFIVDNNRWFLIAILAIIGNLIQASALNHLIPLKETIPYRIEEGINGEVRADFDAFKKYTPKAARIEKTGRKLVSKMYTILGYKSTVSALEEITPLFIGPAVKQFGQWFNKERPTIKSKNDLTLLRSVKIKSSSLLPNNVLLIRFRTKPVSETESVVGDDYIFTGKYVIKPAKNKEEALINPEGIYIEHFTIDIDK